MTLEGFLKHFEDEYKLQLSMVSCGVSIVYSMFRSFVCVRLSSLSLSPSLLRVFPLSTPSLTQEQYHPLLSHTQQTHAHTHTHSAKAKERLQDKLIDVIRDAGVSIDEHQKYLRFEVCASDEDGEEVDMPSVRFSLRK